MRRFTALLTAMAMAGAACSTSQQDDAFPGCDRGAIILVAQSLPDASFVPCINALFEGWTMRKLEAESGRARFWLDSDRVGGRFLEVLFEPACIVGAAGEVPSGEEGIQRFVDVRHTSDTRYQASWYYQFDGGCVTYLFDAEGTNVLVIPGQVDDALGFVPMTEIANFILVELGVEWPGG